MPIECESWLNGRPEGNIIVGNELHDLMGNLVKVVDITATGFRIQELGQKDQPVLDVHAIGTFPEDTLYRSQFPTMEGKLIATKETPKS